MTVEDSDVTVNNDPVPAGTLAAGDTYVTTSSGTFLKLAPGPHVVPSGGHGLYANLATGEVIHLSDAEAVAKEQRKVVRV
jgi:hypothetical protein